MNNAKQLIGAFCVGGFLSLIGQLLLILFTMLIEPGGNPALISLIGPFTLVSMGIVGGILYLLGIFDKLEKVGGFGAFLTFAGLCCAIAHETENSLRQSKSPLQAIKSGVMVLLSIIGVGVIITFVIGAVDLLISQVLLPADPAVTAATGALLAAQAEAATFAIASPNLLIGSFVVGGLLCTLVQAAMIFTSLSVPKVLVLVISVGGLLTAGGQITALSSLGGAGCDIMALGAGSAVTATSQVLLAGNPIPLITVLCVFISLTILGELWGFIRSRKPLKD